MSKKFHGSYGELRERVSQTGVSGEWQELHNQKQFRAKNGAILNWWVSTGTISFQGSPLAAKHLERALFREQIEVAGSGRNETSSTVIPGHRLLRGKIVESAEADDDIWHDELLDDLRADALVVHAKVLEMLDLLKQLAGMAPKGD